MRAGGQDPLEGRDLTSEERAWLGGVTDKLHLGEYGSRVRLSIKNRSVTVEVSVPKRTQRTVGPDGPEARRDGLRVALRTEEGLRQRRRQKLDVPAGADAFDDFSCAGVWKEFLRLKFSIKAPDVLGWGTRKAESYFRSLSREQRKDGCSHDTLNGSLTAARQLHGDGGLAPWDRSVSEIGLGHINRWKERELGRGKRSRQTLDDYLARFQTAVRACQENWKAKWKGVEESVTSVPVARFSGEKADEMGRRGCRA